MAIILQFPFTDANILSGVCNYSYSIMLGDTSNRFVISSLGTFITQVQATDRTALNPVTFNYSLGSYKDRQNDKNWFQINRTSGVITAAKTLDREVIKFVHHEQLTATLLLLLYLNTKRQYRRAHLSSDQHFVRLF